MIDVGPQAVVFLVSLDGRDGVALHRPKLLAGRNPDPAQPSEVLLDSRAAQRFGVHPGDVIPIRVFRFFGEGDFGVFRCDPRHQNPYQHGLPTRREVRQILDSGGTVQWAIGLSKVACYRVSSYDNPARLVVDVQAG